MTDEEYKKILKQYHKLSDRHILVVETDMPFPDVLKVVALSDRIRKAGNELVGLMRKNYDQLLRTKRYRKLLKWCTITSYTWQSEPHGLARGSSQVIEIELVWCHKGIRESGV